MVDVLLWPTVVVLGLIVINFIKNTIYNKMYKKHPKLLEKNLKKNRTFYETVAQLIGITYYVYILIFLIFC